MLAFTVCRPQIPFDSEAPLALYALGLIALKLCTSNLAMRNIYLGTIWYDMPRTWMTLFKGIDFPIENLSSSRSIDC